MYLHLGNDVVINSKSIVGIFDMDTSTIGKDTRRFLELAEKEGRVINVSMELPKSFVVCQEDRQIVYISQISSATLLRRSATVKF